MKRDRILFKLSPDAKSLWREIQADIRSNKPRKDPWEIREAWRYAPEFSDKMARKILYGGCGYGVAAFVVYCLWEHFVWKQPHNTNEAH